MEEEVPPPAHYAPPPYSSIENQSEMETEIIIDLVFDTDGKPSCDNDPFVSAFISLALSGPSKLKQPGHC